MAAALVRNANLQISVATFHRVFRSLVHLPVIEAPLGRSCALVAATHAGDNCAFVCGCKSLKSLLSRLPPFTFPCPPPRSPPAPRSPCHMFFSQHRKVSGLRQNWHKAATPLQLHLQRGQKRREGGPDTSEGWRVKRKKKR